MQQNSNPHSTPGASEVAAQHGKRIPDFNTADNRSRTPAQDARATDPQLANAAGHPWDEAADGWNRHGALVGEWLHDATVAMLDVACIGPGSRVLDIAAGPGDQTLDIARRVGPSGHVLATDISARGLELAQDKLRAAGYDRVETQVADAQALDLAGAGFDAAICRLGLMFFRAPLDTLRGTRDALRPAGRFSALVFSGPQANPCIATLVTTALRHAGSPPASPGAPGTLLSLGQTGLLAELLDTAGFVDIAVRAVSAPMHLPSCQHYIDFVRSAGLPIMAILAPLSAAAQAEAWQDIAAQLDCFTTPTGWVGPNELLLCSATRPDSLNETNHAASV